MRQKIINDEYYHRGVQLGRIIAKDDGEALKSWIENHKNISAKNSERVIWQEVIAIEGLEPGDSTKIAWGRAMVGEIRERLAYKCLDVILKDCQVRKVVLCADQWYTVDTNNQERAKAASNHTFFDLLLDMDEYEIEKWLAASSEGWRMFFQGFIGMTSGNVLDNERYKTTVIDGLRHILNNFSDADGKLLLAAYKVDLVSEKEVESLGENGNRITLSKWHSRDWALQRIRVIEENKKLKLESGFIGQVDRLINKSAL